MCVYYRMYVSATHLGRGFFEASIAPLPRLQKLHYTVDVVLTLTRRHNTFCGDRAGSNDMASREALFVDAKYHSINFSNTTTEYLKLPGTWYIILTYLAIM